MQHDVIVIGAGIVGASCAYYLSKHQLSVLVLDKNSEAAFEATKANSGIVHAGFDCKEGTLKAKLNVRGNQLYRELAEELAIPLRLNGAYVLALDASDRPKLEELLARGVANGVPNMQIIERDALLTDEPNLNPDVHAALFAPTSGITFGYEATVALAEVSANNGVDYAFEQTVTGIEKTAVGYIVKTQTATYTTRTIINAAGMYSDVINNYVNTKHYHVHPRKGEYLLLDTDAKYIVDKTIFQLPSKLGKGILVLPTIHDNILVGPSALDITDKEDKSTHADTLKNNVAVARQSIPNLPMHMTITSFSGLRASLTDHDDFAVEATESPGFYNAVGINSPGLTAAPAIGELIAQWVSDYLGASPNTNWNGKRAGIVTLSTLDTKAQNELIAENPAYGRIVCRCEMITEAEIVAAIQRTAGARTTDGIKFRTRAMTGRCQGGFCTQKVLEIMAREMGKDVHEITKFGAKSYVLAHDTNAGKEGCGCNNN